MEEKKEFMQDYYKVTLFLSVDDEEDLLTAKFSSREEAVDYVEKFLAKQMVSSTGAEIGEIEHVSANVTDEIMEGISKKKIHDMAETLKEETKKALEALWQEREQHREKQDYETYLALKEKYEGKKEGE